MNSVQQSQKQYAATNVHIHTQRQCIGLLTVSDSQRLNRVVFLSFRLTFLFVIRCFRHQPTEFFKNHHRLSLLSLPLNKNQPQTNRKLTKPAQKVIVFVWFPLFPHQIKSLQKDMHHSIFEQYFFGGIFRHLLHRDITR